MSNNRRCRHVEPGGDDVLVWTRREMAQAVKAAPDALVASSAACVAEQGAPVHARLERLLGGGPTALKWTAARSLTRAVAV
jgi:hypothetical protein